MLKALASNLALLFVLLAGVSFGRLQPSTRLRFLEAVKEGGVEMGAAYIAWGGVVARCAEVGRGVIPSHLLIFSSSAGGRAHAH